MSNSFALIYGLPFPPNFLEASYHITIDFIHTSCHLQLMRVFVVILQEHPRDQIPPPAANGDSSNGQMSSQIMLTVLSNPIFRECFLIHPDAIRQSQGFLVDRL